MRGIEELKVQPGDEVCFLPHYPNDGEKHWLILTVTKVTAKAGQITTSDGRRFDKDGFEIGGTTQGEDHPAIIRPLTPEIRARIEYARNLEVMKTFDYASLSREAVTNIVAILRAEPKAVFPWATALDCIECGLEGDREKARRYAELLLERLKASGDEASARGLQRILEGSKGRIIYPAQEG